MSFRIFPLWLLIASVCCAWAADPKDVQEFRRQMFEPPLNIVADRSIELMFNTVRVEAGADPSRLPQAPAQLDFTYEYAGVRRPALDVIERTFTDALLIIKNGTIVYEGYFNLSTPQTHFNSYSAAKSINAVLVGAALRDGALTSVEEPLTQHVPELEGTGYAGVTVRQLLQMRSGVDWDENFFEPGTSGYRAHVGAWVEASSRFTDAALTVKRRHAPGSVFYYNTLDSALVGKVVERATKMSVSRYLSERVWKPAGMESYGFYLIDGLPGVGREFTGGGFNAVLRDYGRLGLLMLNEGRANGQQILPTAYVKELASTSASAQETDEPDLGYGYLWWTVNGSRAFTALGGEGQFVFVDPDTQTVIVKLSHGPVGPKFEDVQRETVSFLKAASRWQAVPKDPVTHSSTTTRK